MEYVTIQKLSEMIGYSEKAIRRKIEKMQWLKNVHYIKAPDGRIMMIPEEISKWLGGQHYEKIKDRRETERTRY